MFVTGIIRLFRSNCPRGVQKRISLEAAIYYAANEKHAFTTPLEGKMIQKSFILGSSSSLSSPELSLSSCSLVLFFNQIYLSLHFDEYRWETWLRMINFAMRHLFYSIRKPKLETTGANTSSIKPLPSCTRTRLFVFLLVLYNLHPLATPTKIKCLPLNSFKKEYKLFLLDSFFVRDIWTGQVK